MNWIESALNNQIGLREAIASLPVLAANLVSHAMGRRNILSPSFVTWALTTECQCHCAHCRLPPYEEIGPEDRLAIAEDLGHSWAWGVSLIGGEPLLVPETLQLARVLKGHGKRVSIGTNGLLLGRFAEDLVRHRVDAVYVSVDSHRASVHDELRNTAGLFQEVSGAIRELRILRQRRRSRVPRIVVRGVISRRNYRDLDCYVRHWLPLADGILLQPVQQNGIHEVRDSGLLFEERDEEPLRRVMEKLRRRYRFFRNSYYDNLPGYIFDPERLHERLGFRCLLVTGCSLTVAPNGSVMVCFGNKDSVVGNLLTESLGDVWRSRRTRSVQRGMRQEPCSHFCWETHQLYNNHLLRLQSLLKDRWRTAG